MAGNKGLGRGIDALFVSSLDQSLIEEDKNRIRMISVEQIRPNDQQPRSTFDESALDELANSIAQHGVIQPIIVTKDEQGYQLVAGERRWRASQKAGLTEVPAIVRSLEELEKLEVALIENVQRVDLSPLEQAASIYKLHQQFSIEYGEIAKRLGKASTTVSNIVRLLQLPEAAAEALTNGEISEGHARAILALAGQPALQAELLKKITGSHWTVRQAEAFVVNNKAGKTVVDMAPVKPNTKENPALTKHFNLSVLVKKQKRGGQVIIKYNNQAEFDRLNKQLLGH